VNNQIKEFLLSANTQGYGSADVNEEKLPNGEHIIRFQMILLSSRIYIMAANHMRDKR
jgi:hypothetical protein